MSLASGEANFTVPDEVGKTYDIEIQLPTDLTCDQCILQWTYRAGNNWGVDPDGHGCVGCGAQEHFRTCSDIRISEEKIQQAETKTCSGLPPYDKVKKINEWCNSNCNSNVSFCPRNICHCI